MFKRSAPLWKVTRYRSTQVISRIDQILKIRWHESKGKNRLKHALSKYFQRDINRHWELYRTGMIFPIWVTSKMQKLVWNRSHIESQTIQINEKKLINPWPKLSHIHTYPVSNDLRHRCSFANGSMKWLLEQRYPINDWRNTWWYCFLLYVRLFQKGKLDASVTILKSS